MTLIIDISVPCAYKAAQLRLAGVTTVIRYYSRDTIGNKRLTPTEARVLAGAGLRLGIVHEGRFGNKPSSFEHGSGVADARYSRTYGASLIGQPGGSTIYFGVDFDATAQQIAGRVLPYFRGVADAFAEATGEPDYVVGVYGSGAVCAAVLDAGLAKMAWLAQSTGWSGYKTLLKSARWALSQAMSSKVAGLECDANTPNATNDFGDFVLGQPGAALAGTGLSVATAAASRATPAARPMRVGARDGLRLRAGPGTEFDVIRTLPLGAPVFALKNFGAWTLADLQGDGAADGYLSTGFLMDDAGSPTASPAATLAHTADAVRIPELIRQGSTAASLAAAAKTAAAAWKDYPHNGCAAHLSALLQQAGIDVPMTLGAGKLAQIIEARGWTRIAVGQQQPGDIGVCYDANPNPKGADHIYLVVSIIGPNEMMVADNQRKTDAPHPRSAIAGGPFTGTEYFLRAV